MSTSEPLNKDHHQAVVLPVWVIENSDDGLRMILSLGVPRIGDSVTLDSIVHTVTAVNWNHVPRDDGSMFLRPELTLRQSRELQT